AATAAKKWTGLFELTFQRSSHGIRQVISRSLYRSSSTYGANHANRRPGRRVLLVCGGGVPEAQGGDDCHVRICGRNERNCELPRRVRRGNQSCGGCAHWV